MRNLPQQSAVFLVGFMGAGKTAVGAALARSLGWKFIDLDQQIEQTQQRAIAEIFQSSGEAGFRRIESERLGQLLKSLKKSEPAVIALGGGTFAQPENAEKLRHAGATVVFLDAPLDELLRRCQEVRAQQTRPMLDRDKDALSVLYAERRPGYLAADATVQTDGKSVAEVAGEIERWLSQRLGLLGIRSLGRVE